MLSSPIPSKADIRLIRSLGQKKFRQEYGLFVVEGEKMVGEALAQSRFPVEAVYYTEDIGKETMAKMSQLSSPAPALAVLRIPNGNQNRGHSQDPTPSQDDLTAAELPHGLCLGLDSVRDPGNIGTILRLADWFGIDTVYFSPDCADLYNPKTVQSTMGSIFRQRAVICDLLSLARRCTGTGIPVYATALCGEDIRTFSLETSRALILMGSERDGLTPELMEMASGRLHIPSFGIDGRIRGERPDAGTASVSAESLNVAIATAVCCYEFRRRQLH